MHWMQCCFFSSALKCNYVMMLCQDRLKCHTCCILALNPLTPSDQFGTSNTQPSSGIKKYYTRASNDWSQALALQPCFLSNQKKPSKGNSRHRVMRPDRALVVSVFFPLRSGNFHLGILKITDFKNIFRKIYKMLWKIENFTPMKIEKSSKTPKLLSKSVSFRREKRAGNFGI